MFDSEICGAGHFCDPKTAQPFVIGWMDVTRPFVHILDDDSLDILLSDRDTITDFVEYLRWKEAFLASAKDRKTRILYCGEEDVLAGYLLNIKNGEHGFSLPTEPLDVLCIPEGDWEDFVKSDQRASQIGADKDSYFWDALIERFCKNILGGTSYDRATALIADREKSVRLLAHESRMRRRILAHALIDLIRNTKNGFRASRVLWPSRTGDPYYCFLLMPSYSAVPYETYREARGRHLEALCRVTKLVYPDALDIVGIATETGIEVTNRSEDVIYLDARGWNDDEQEHARELQTAFNLLTNVTMHHVKDSEFPIGAQASRADRDLTPKIGKNPRNRPCPCGSGKKYKKCHGA